jgi:hypothetical protein
MILFNYKKLREIELISYSKSDKDLCLSFYGIIQEKSYCGTNITTISYSNSIYFSDNYLNLINLKYSKCFTIKLLESNIKDILE